MELPRRLRVFLCHAHADKPAVRQLYRRLCDDGFQPWLDEEDLSPGDEWQREIPKAVRAADIVLVCLTRQSINKAGYVQKEIKFALDIADEKPEGTVFVIPARLEECDVPERLSRWQWVNLFDETGYARVQKVLASRAGQIQVPAPAAPAGPEALLQPRPSKVNPDDGQPYVWIPPGEFRMGCSPGGSEGYDDEKPAHTVRITRGFWLGQTPVTVGTYKRFAQSTGVPMPGESGPNPEWSDSEQPMVAVTWQEATAYCESWAKGRLPTEAEWECAARAGTAEPRYGQLDDIAWYAGNSGNGIHPVRQKQPNPWGLYDMLGNLWEWVEDWYGEDYYRTLPSPAVDPKGPPKGTQRVLRGGSWVDYPWDVRASGRLGVEPEVRYNYIGFRCAREVIP